MNWKIFQLLLTILFPPKIPIYYYISIQKKLLSKYAKGHHFPNPKFYVDDGYAGTNYNRPGFQEMIEDIEAGYVTTVIVKDMSRLGRNYLQVGYYTDTFSPSTMSALLQSTMA